MRAYRLIKSAIRPYLPPFTFLSTKEAAELGYWRGKLSEETALSNSHYEFFFTTFFGLTTKDFSGKTIIDIGCGPRGSLEWATMAKQRIGADSLVSKYRALGIDRHRMTYVDAPAERIPFEDGCFDFVASFNSLDHVDILEKSISEIARVSKLDGTFLLICEVNHQPTVTEPVQVTERQLKSMLSEAFKIVSWRSFATPADHDLYSALQMQSPLLEDADDDVPIIIAARMTPIGCSGRKFE